MSIDEYFKGDGIVQKLVMEASPRHKLVLTIADETDILMNISGQVLMSSWNVLTTT